MSPTARYIIRAALVGVAAVAASLQASAPDIGWEQAMQAVIAGVVALSAYLGIGAATTVEPAVGKTTDT